MTTATSFLQKGVDDHVYTSASLVVSHNNQVIIDESIGLNENQIYFDIASLTKPMATATLMMLAVQEKKLSLDEDVRTFFPAIKISNARLTHLLNHTSGLPDWRPYFENQQAAQGKGFILDQIINEEPVYKTGEQVLYSDLGYILLGEILEKVYVDSLDQIFAEKIAKPFGLDHTFFNSIAKKHQSNPDLFIPSETCPWRNKALQGEVMDDHAYLMNGIAGHAGLFSTCHDILKWLEELDKAQAGKSDLIAPNTFKTFCQIPTNRNLNTRYFTLGFDTPSQPSQSGQHFSANSLGHLGYTGCSFWWDLDKNLKVILLTNRTYPDRNNDAIKTFRPQLHDLLGKSLLT